MMMKYLAILAYLMQVSCNLSTMTACGFLNMAVVKSAAQVVSSRNQATYLQSCKNALQWSGQFRPPKQDEYQRLPEEHKLTKDFNISFGLFTAGTSSWTFLHCLQVSSGILWTVSNDWLSAVVKFWYATAVLESSSATECDVVQHGNDILLNRLCQHSR